MKHFTKILLAAGALAVSALSHALPVINQWDVTAVGTWIAPITPSTVTNSGTLLSWGTGGSGPSSLQILNPSTANISTYTLGGAVPDSSTYVAPSISLVHTNKPINPGSSLTSATLAVALTLKPTSPAFPNLPSSTINYHIAFSETTNATPCVAPSPSGNPCNDIFVLVEGLLNEEIDYLGETYFVNAFPRTAGGVLSTLTQAECRDALGASYIGTCLGFTTIEGQQNTLPFGLTISSERLAVPEPGSLALIGLALAGLGFVTRRRSSAA